MEVWITHLALHGPYIVIVGLLLLSGFGLPLPEEIPVLVAGYLSALHYANPCFMLPAVLIAILGADMIIFSLGRHYGHHVPRLPVVKRFLTPNRVRRAENLLDKHGGKFIFVARFLPGLRAPVMFSAGAFKLSFWRFLFYDITAAMVSIPTIFLLAYFFARQFDKVRKWVAEGQLLTGLIILAVIAAVIVIKVLSRQRFMTLINGS